MKTATTTEVKKSKCEWCGIRNVDNRLGRHQDILCRVCRPLFPTRIQAAALMREEIKQEERREQAYWDAREQQEQEAVAAGVLD